MEVWHNSEAWRLSQTQACCQQSYTHTTQAAVIWIGSSRKKKKSDIKTE